MGEAASTAEEVQSCYRCHEVKPLSAYRRFAKNRNGKDHICRGCRKARYRAIKAMSFGPLPGAEGSGEWVGEIWRGAATIRSERRRGPAQDLSA